MMDREQRRTGIAGILLVMAFALTAYQLIVPSTAAATVIATILGITMIFIILVEHRSQPDQWPSLSWIHTVLITIISGMATIITVYAATTAFLLITQYVRSHFLAMILYELLQQIRFLEAVAPTGFIILYGAAVFLFGTGFWFLHPYATTSHYGNAVLLFPLLALYFGAVGAVFFPILRPIILTERGMDVVFAVIWGIFFTAIYRRIRERL